MDLLYSIFFSDIFDRPDPNIARFKNVCNATNISLFKHDDVVGFAIMLLYVETHVISRFINTYHCLKQDSHSSGSLRGISDIVRGIILHMENQASFIASDFTNSSVNAIKLSINCMKKKKIEDWCKYHTKLSTAAHKLVTVNLPRVRHPESEIANAGEIPLSTLLTQLSEFVQQEITDSHPSLWLNDTAVRLRVREMRVRFQNLKSDERLVDSWLRLFLSVDCSLDATHRSSTASQTDEMIELERLAQSTPDKTYRFQTKRLITSNSTNFLEGVSSPSDTSYHARGSTSPDRTVRRKSGNLGLTIGSLGEDDGASATTESRTARRRVPWTLAETLALWHEVKMALPDPPSWAKIRDKAFPSSRRTNVDLKDRWRVILRDPELQKLIGLYYDKWLVSKNLT